jgi:lipopolysaccharide transport system permease protein
MLTLWAEFCALWRARVLLLVLTKREVAARYAGTVMGKCWVYLQPLLTILAFYLVFDVVFNLRLGAEAPTRAVGTFLIVGILPWMAFCDAVSRGMNSLIDAGSLLQKNPLPPVLFAARAVLASTVIYAPLMLLVFLAYTPLHQFGWAALAFFPLMLLQFLLSLLIGYFLAIMAAALRDVTQLVGFMLSVGIYLSPILFPLTQFPENWRWVLWLNPITALVTGYHQVLLLGAWPMASSWWVTGLWLVVLALALNRVVARSRDQLVDWL